MKKIVKYASFYRTFLSSLFDNGPTYAHKALAELEAMGKMQGIITTNQTMNKRGV